MYLSVIIPVYNSREIIHQTVEILDRCLEANGYDFEIILRDDGSKDNAQDCLKEIALQYQKARCFFNGRNRGLGFTLRRLFSDARGDIIVYVDCDLPFGEAIVPLLVNQIQNYDIVLASHYKGIKSNIRLSRCFFSRTYYLLCKVLFGIAVLDIGSGSVAFRRKVVDTIPLFADGFAIHAEIFLRAARAGFTIKEIPHAAREYVYPGTFRILRHGFNLLWETLVLGYGMKR